MTIALTFWPFQTLRCQPANRFEVAVIRPSQTSSNAGTRVELLEGGRLKIANEPVQLLIRIAFGVQDPEIVGGPNLLVGDRYDIEAKTGRPGKIGQAELGPLMQDLLAERFHLKFHREPRALSVYALVCTKDGPKLKPQVEGEEPGMSTNNGQGVMRLVVTATSMDLLAKYIGNRLGQIVIDKTGLRGAYDFTLEWAAEAATDSSAPSLTTALREQLGLRLEARKSPVEVLAIDSIDRPTEN